MFPDDGRFDSAGGAATSVGNDCTADIIVLISSCTKSVVC